MPRTKEPQVLPPVSAVSGLSDQALEALATILDDAFRIPGTQFRFGLDPLIGLVPGLGDAISGAASFLIIYAGWQRRVPKVTLARMVANVAIDSLVGSMPVVGDAFDAAYKSNRKNLNLLRRAQLDTRRRQQWHDFLFLLLIAVAIAALVAIPLVVLWLIVTHLRH